ncbi:MAG: hypothetical protein FWH12_02380 [Treponema sp.]|nr:hypothetical protein [Treponema sp.]
MTKTQYRREHYQARATCKGLTIQAGKQIRREYIRIASIVAKAIRACPNKMFLEETVRAAFPRKELHDFITALVKDGRGKAAQLVADINKKHLFGLLDKVKGHGLSKEKIAAMFDANVEKVRQANSMIHYQELQANSIHRTYRGTGFAYRPDGTWGETERQRTFRQSYPLSTSVWTTVNKTEERLLDVVWGGISQGRDIRTISQDIMAFAQGGPAAMPGRWGKLLPGTREYARRLGGLGPDYRAIRLYRSELYRNMQEESIAEGKNNPACTGLYDWVRFGGREDTCSVCMALAAGSPYTAETVPEYPHANCLCSVQPRLKDDDEFIQQLRDFVNGDDSPGAHEIEEWARENNLMEDGLSSPFSQFSADETPPVALDHNPDYSKYDISTAVSIESEYLRNYSEIHGKEAMSIMSGNNVLGSWEGTKEGINLYLNHDIMSILNDPDISSLRIIHTHLDDSTFSIRDIRTLRKNKSVSELIAYGVNGNFYSMKVPESGIRDLRFFNMQYSLIESKMLNEIPLLPNEEFMNELYKRLSNKLHWVFRHSQIRRSSKIMSTIKNSRDDLERYLEEQGRKGLDSGDEADGFSLLLALEYTKVLQKDIEAFKKLSPEEQEVKFWEYKSEMDALSDEELAERYEKYF